MDVSALAHCSSLHTLSPKDTEVTDVLALSGSSSLHTLNSTARVTDVSALARCSSLHKLDLRVLAACHYDIVRSSGSSRHLVSDNTPHRDPLIT